MLRFIINIIIIIGFYLSERLRLFSVLVRRFEIPGLLSEIPGLLSEIPGLLSEIPGLLSELLLSWSPTLQSAEVGRLKK
jgi:hypothetical protein